MKTSLNNSSQNRILRTLVLASAFLCGASLCIAQESGAADGAPVEKYGVWLRKEDASGKQFRQMHLRVYPKAASIPAFKHRLIPAAKDRVDGNAAIFYLKAAGFFEQSHAREQLTKLLRKWRDEANEEDRDAGDYYPNTWYDAAPESLPMDEVRHYLLLHSFQPEFLYDAARRTRFEHDRAIEREPNPIGYLLPSIQQHRELARVQTVRCRFAIAEGRIDDAVEIVGQMMALGSHLGKDEFLVSCLVGAACHEIGVDAGFVLSQQENTPNLYWAIAACPKPAIDLSRAIAMERNFLFLQMPILNEVTERVRPASFWADFARQFSILGNEVANEYTQNSGNKDGEKTSGFKAATAIAKDYPTARDFLHDVSRMSNEQLDRYPKAQVVFLAIVKYNEFAQDEVLKDFVSPMSNLSNFAESGLIKYWRSRFNPGTGTPDIGKSILPLADMLIPASSQVLAAAASVEQRQNLWQTVEALRLTAAENGGEFPESLEQLAVPAPLDPATNRPFEYEVNQGVATLRSAKLGYRGASEIRLELANRDELKETNE